jgi:hypothetical protein
MQPLVHQSCPVGQQWVAPVSDSPAGQAQAETPLVVVQTWPVDTQLMPGKVVVAPQVLMLVGSRQAPAFKTRGAAQVAAHEVTPALVEQT